MLRTRNILIGLAGVILTVGFIEGFLGNTVCAAILKVPDAYPTIQEAINAANAHDEVWVAGGDYDENLVMKADVDLYGSWNDDFTVRGLEIYPTVVDGGGRGPVVVGAANTIIDYFVLRNGNAPLGGGICCEGAPMSIQNNRIEYNTASQGGGGVYFTGARVHIWGNTVENNAAPAGGGVFGLHSGPYTTIEDNEILTNQILDSGTGGGLHIDHCEVVRIRGNRVEHNVGGGIDIQNTDVFEITNNSISFNYTRFFGGGLSIAGGSPNADVRGNTIKYNWAEVGGGGVFSHGGTYITANDIEGNSASGSGAKGGGLWLEIHQGTSPKLTNNLIHGNEADGVGGGIYMNFGKDIVILNNTIANNKPDGANRGGGIYVSAGATAAMVNTILWNNGDDWYEEGSGSSYVIYCDIEDGDFLGTDGNISADPRFVDPYWDLHITANSPCRDAGYNPPAPPDDFDGDSRPYGLRVDIGADEYWPRWYPDPTPIPLPWHPIPTPIQLPGDDIVVPLVDPSGSVSLTLTFQQVTAAGTVSLSIYEGPTLAPPSGMALGDPPVYFDVTTTAEFLGPIEVCIDFGWISFVGPPEALTLWQYEQGQWIDCTDSVDVPNQTICGSVMSLAPLAILEDTAPPEVSGELTALETEENEGLFKVQFDAVDNSDPDPVVEAVMVCGSVQHTVSNGQRVSIELKDKCEMKRDDGILKIECPHTCLVVTATDASGNVGTCTAYPQFVGDDDDEDDNGDE